MNRLKNNPKERINLIDCLYMNTDYGTTDSCDPFLTNHPNNTYNNIDSLLDQNYQTHTNNRNNHL